MIDDDSAAWLNRTTAIGSLISGSAQPVSTTATIAAAQSSLSISLPTVGEPDGTDRRETERRDPHAAIDSNRRAGGTPRMTFVWVAFVGSLPPHSAMRFEAVSGFYCDDAGKASVDKIIERAKERYCAKADCKIESLQQAVDTIEFHSDVDFPMF
jgi:hypothetical protein